MLSKLSLVLTCGVLASSFSMSAQASPFLSFRPQPTAVIKLVRDGCGLGFHWAACGCIRNYTVCPVIVAPVAPVVVAPHYAPPVVATPAACPYGYYLGPAVMVATLFVICLLTFPTLKGAFVAPS